MRIRLNDSDETVFRDRPGKGSRPRTKRRPEHRSARLAQIVGISRGRSLVRLGGFEGPGPEVAAVKARELHRTSLAVGDLVQVEGDLSGGPDALARIVRRNARRTVLLRSGDDRDQQERIVVANVDVLLVVCAAADPLPRPGFFDRCVIAAVNGGIEPRLIISKSDLGQAESLRARAAQLDVPVQPVTREETPGFVALKTSIAGQVCALVGHSGVGKSTLLNRLIPDAHRDTGHVNQVTGRGRHTSSSACAYPWAEEDQQGWIVDTPGVRSFGLGHVEAAHFAERWAGQAGKELTSLPPEQRPDAANAVEDLHLRRRLQSLCELLTVIEGGARG